MVHLKVLLVAHHHGVLLDPRLRMDWAKFTWELFHWMGRKRRKPRRAAQIRTQRTLNVFFDFCTVCEIYWISVNVSILFYFIWNDISSKASFNKIK